jgi:dTDP-4-amino-4,6-dideoxygalactose transaminase
LQLEGVDRYRLQDYLAARNIPAMIYYPVPAHKQKMFEHFGSSQMHLPVTDLLTQRVISLPIHTEMDEEQLRYITTNILDFLNK